MTDRRRVLMGLAAALGGPAALAACDSGGSDDAILNAIRPDGRLAYYSRREFRLVGLIADAIIPDTDTPGALGAGVPAYLDAMMGAWASRETKRTQRAQLRVLRDALADIGGRDLHRLPDAARREAVGALDAAAFGEDWNGEASVAYRALKQLIAAVYYSTEIGASQELRFELVPGRWLGDAPLAEFDRTWAE